MAGTDTPLPRARPREAACEAASVFTFLGHGRCEYPSWSRDAFRETGYIGATDSSRRGDRVGAKAGVDHLHERRGKEGEHETSL